jgi:hypothetical protein
MPLAITPPSGAEAKHEGPLALEYRSWGTEVMSPEMAHPDDVTYSYSRRPFSYDGTVYGHIILDQVDDK